MATALVPAGSTALAVAPRALLRPIAAASEIIEAQNAARDMVHQALKEGRDFGVIPGTGDKPTMLKPGAERVALGFGCYYGDAEIIEKEIDHDREVHWVKRRKQWNNAHKNDRTFTWIEESGVSRGLYRYVIRVPVIERASGETVGSGVGTCSTMESKYVDRPRDTENTVLKMAYKRAMVAACLTTFGLSDEFTQDVEDLPRATEREERDGENADVDRAPAPVEEPLTVERALEMPLPGKEGAWGGQAGKPLGQIPAKMVGQIHRWAAKKIEADGDKAAANVVLLRDACALIVEMRGPAPDPKAETAAPTDPTFEQLAASIHKLLQHESVTEAQRLDFTQRAGVATSAGALVLLISEIEDLSESPI